jgi:uncharacterized glyoxalase superfamily protein PhnB
MLGKAGLDNHFEFTYCRTHPVRPSHTPEDLVVFYLPAPAEWQGSCRSMLEAGFTEVSSFNPYWQQRGRTFEDHDRYRVVLEQDAWTNNPGGNPTSTGSTTPAGWHSVTPRIVVHDVRALVAFVCDVFGAEGEYDPAAPAIVTIGDSRILISDALARRPNAAFLYVYVRDADSTYRRALERGATSIEEPFETPYGDRRCMVEDPWGNTWQIAMSRADERAA